MGPDRFTRAARTATVLIITAILIASANSTSALIVGLCALAALVGVLIVAVAYGKS